MKIPIEEAKKNLTHLSHEAQKGKVVIIKDGAISLKLVYMRRKRKIKRLRKFFRKSLEKTPMRKAGSAKGLIKISDDFDAPLEEFKEYME